MSYKILLFYKYTHIEHPNQFRDEHFDLCQGLGMKGRFIVAHEGINGTLEGTEEACNEYMQIMENMEIGRKKVFANIHWKVSEGTTDGTAFPRLSVKTRKEIVSLHLGTEKDIDPNEITGTHLKPADLRKWYEEGKEFHIVDMRNDYELKVGKFEGTVFPDLNNFRDLKKNIKKLEEIKGKTVLTVCTGGVRCEKASGLLVREGFENVYQLDGGIVSYMEQFPGQDFKGSLYVFDKRNTMHFEDPDKHEVIGKCKKCKTKSEQYVNCANLMCHEHFICCDDCLQEKKVDNPYSGLAYCNLWCKIEWKLRLLYRKLKKLAI